MRTIKYIVLHCTASSQTAKVSSILNYFKNTLKWKNPGYHFMITPTGEIVETQPIAKIANGVKKNNANAIHIAYIGGIDAKGNALDNRTTAQKAAQVKLLTELKKQFPTAEIRGHRDFPSVRKDCPSFDVKKWLREIGFKI